MDDEALAAIDLAVEGDEQLLREALEALERMSTSFKKLLAQVIAERGASDLKPQNQADVVRARATITKLEERLLQE
ncbi:MAG: hypothetical protein V3U27_21500 [Candidatus Tectomicrobia bacterium]